MLTTGGAVGRKLDFLLQEMNREANTIGSKCTDVRLARVVVEIKAELEKDPGADPEHRVRSSYEACEHRFRQHGCRGAGSCHCQRRTPHPSSG